MDTRLPSRVAASVGFPARLAPAIDTCCRDTNSVSIDVQRSEPSRLVAIAIACVASSVAAEEPGDQDAMGVHLTHKTMTTRVGSPAVVKPGETFPSVEVVSRSRDAGTVDGELVREDDGAAVRRVAARVL